MNEYKAITIAKQTISLYFFITSGAISSRRRAVSQSPAAFAASRTMVYSDDMHTAIQDMCDHLIAKPSIWDLHAIGAMHVLVPQVEN